MREGEDALTLADLAMAAELLADMAYQVAERAAVLQAALALAACPTTEDIEGVA